MANGIQYSKQLRVFIKTSISTHFFGNFNRTNGLLHIQLLMPHIFIDSNWQAAAGWMPFLETFLFVHNLQHEISLTPIFRSVHSVKSTKTESIVLHRYSYLFLALNKFIHILLLFCRFFCVRSWFKQSSSTPWHC